MDLRFDRQIAPRVQEVGAICRSVLVIFGRALCESRTAQILEDLAPAGGLVIEANSGCLRNRRQVFEMACRLADSRGSRHRTLLLRRLDRMTPQKMRQLAAWVRNRRLNADWRVFTCVTPPGVPELERYARHIERCLAPELVVDLRAAGESFA